MSNAPRSVGRRGKSDQQLRQRKGAVAPNKKPQSTSSTEGDDTKSESLNWTESEEKLAVFDRQDTARTIHVKRTMIKNSVYAPALENMPRFLKEGPWSPLSYLFLLIVIYGMYDKYGEAKDSGWDTTENVNLYRSYHDNNPQYYGPLRVIIGLYMMGITIGVARDLGVQPLTTFTIMSWNILTLRYIFTGLLTATVSSVWNTSTSDQISEGDDSASLSSSSSQMKYMWSLMSLITEFLRFPSLVCSSITVSIWWIILVPAIFFYLPSSNSRKAFLKFNLRFVLINVHLANAIFAAIDHLSVFRALRFADLYASVSVALVYVLIYLFVMDPLGLVWYHIFLSPRPHWCILCYILTLALFPAVFHLWSQVKYE